jgi:hypothetical protein
MILAVLQSLFHRHEVINSIRSLSIAIGAKSGEHQGSESTTSKKVFSSELFANNKLYVPAAVTFLVYIHAY